MTVILFFTISFIGKIANKYGSQAVVVSIDYKKIDGGAIVYKDFAKESTGLTLKEWAIRCKEEGAGELFLNAIDRDGKGNGFDIQNIEMVCQSVNLPVVACGGAGEDYDFVELANKTSVSGLAAGNFFHFTELSYPRVKKILKEENINVR